MVVHPGAGNFTSTLVNTILVDRGGPTNMGVTAGTLKTAFERGLVGHHNVKILTRSEAAKIYEVLYWGPSKASQMPWPLNLLHFDAAVHLGVGGAGPLQVAGLVFKAR